MLQTKRLFTGIVLLLLPFISAEAQQAMTLKQCLEYGLQNHPSIDVAEYNVGTAKQRVKEGYSGYLPQINGSFGLDYNLKLQTNVIPAGTFGPDPIKVRFGTKYNSAANLQWDQKIYDQTYITGFTAFKPSINLAQMQQTQTREDVAYNVATSYVNVLVVTEKIKLLRTNLDSYTKLLQVSELQLAKGVIKQTDFDRIRVNVNNIKSQLSLAESNLQVAENSLKVNMGMTDETKLVLTDTTDFKTLQAEQPGATFNYANRIDYKIAERNVMLQEIQLKRAKAAYVPTISAYARYGAQGLNDDFSELWKTWYDYSAVGLKVNVPIFDGMYKDAKVKQQKYTYLTEKRNLDLYKMNFKLQYENASVQLQRSRVSALNDNENLLLAQQVFNQTSLQYQSGVATLSDLLNAENAYKEAQSNYINSLLNLRISELDVQRANGTLLIFLNIQ